MPINSLPQNHPNFWNRVNQLMASGISSIDAYNMVVVEYSSVLPTIDPVNVSIDGGDLVEPPNLAQPDSAAPAGVFHTTWHNSFTTNSLTGWAQETVSTPRPASKKVKEPTLTEEERKMRVLQDLYSYPALVFRKQDSINFERGNKISGDPFPFITTNGMLGIEVEVENITNTVPIVAYWNSHADGSLRNNGAEFVSVPLQVKQVQLALEHLYGAMKNTNKYDFSNRTSIHIHLNCRDLTQDQVYSMVLLYCIFEKYFYSFTGTKRLNSIFCVPIFRSNILKYAKDLIYGFSPNGWHKYCGLNLLPLVDNNNTRAYGTIEFRHLYGTDDQKAILEWIDTILCLRNAVLNTITLEELMKDIESMNTSSSYCSLFAKVFPNKKIPNNGKEFEECISNIKRELYLNTYLGKLSKHERSPYWTTCEKLGVRG